MSSFNLGNTKIEVKNDYRPHPDLEQNIAYAKDVIKNSEPHWKPGMRMMLGNSDMYPQSLLYITYKSPSGPDFATPVNLNQPHEIIKNEINKLINVYHKYAEKPLGASSRTIGRKKDTTPPYE